MHAGRGGPSGSVSSHGRRLRLKGSLVEEVETQHIKDFREFNRGVNAVRLAPLNLYHYFRGTSQAGAGIKIEMGEFYPTIIDCTAPHKLVEVGIAGRNPQFQDDQQELIQFHSISKGNPITSGDKLIEVNYVSTSKLPYEEVAKMLNGYKGTTIELLVKTRLNVLLKVKVSRQESHLRAYTSNLHERLLSRRLLTPVSC